MIDHRNRKKKLIISYKNLTDNLRELFKETYPEGYKDYLQKTIKPSGEPIFVVPLETDDTSYMIKFDVTIDTGMVEEDLDKDIYGNDDEQSESEFAPLSEAIDKEEGNNHSVGKMRHGAIEEFEGLPEDKKEFELADADLDDEYGDSADNEDDSYIDDDEKNDDDMEPNDEDLLDIEALLAEADSGEGMLREDNPPAEKRKRGRKPKSLNPDVASVQAVGKAVKDAKEAKKSSMKVKKETPKIKTKSVTTVKSKSVSAVKTKSATSLKTKKVTKEDKTATKKIVVTKKKKS